MTGRVVCPGFVDIHTHSDLTLLSSALAHSKVRQGVTTEVVGNCGLGVAPIGPATDLAALRSALAYLDLDPSVELTWRTVGEYLDAVAGTSVHVATLVGHIPVRAAVVGFDDRPATTAEIDAMCALVAEALADGALGLSTGLVYPPLRAARTDELRALAAVVADHDALFAWHLRDYGDDLLTSAAEAVQIAAVTGARTQISHLSSIGERNWGTVDAVLAMAGDSVGVDIYPYLHGNAPLSQLLPDLVGVGALTDPVARERVEHAWLGNPVPWTEITVAGGAADDVLGRTIASLAEADRSASAVAMDLIAVHGHNVIMTAGGRSERDLRTVLGHPATVVASDGMALDPDGPTGRGFPHPTLLRHVPPCRHRLRRRRPGPGRHRPQVHTGARAARRAHRPRHGRAGTTRRSGGAGHGTACRSRYLHPAATFSRRRRSSLRRRDNGCGGRTAHRFATGHRDSGE